MAEEEAAAPAAAAAEEEVAADSNKENGDANEDKADAPADAEPKPDGEIVKCDKPNKEEFERKTQALNDEIAALNNKLTKIDEDIRKTKASGGGQMDDLTQARAQMKQLRDQKVRASACGRTRAESKTPGRRGARRA